MMAHCVAVFLLFAWHLSYASAVLLNQIDRAALESLRVDFGGSGRTVSWRGTWCGTYSGVRCNKAGRVISLQVGGTGLRRAIPAHVCDLTALTSLDLSNTGLRGPIPECVGARLTRLTDLRLQRNQLSGAIPASLCNLTAISTMELQRNRLFGFIPDCLGSLQRLRLLNLSSNQLAGGLPTFKTMTGLVRVDSNYLTGLSVVQFANGTNGCMTDNCCFVPLGIACPPAFFPQRTRGACTAFCDAASYITFCGGAGVCFLNGTAPTCVCDSGYTNAPKRDTCAPIAVSPPPSPPMPVQPRYTTGLVFPEADAAAATRFFNAGFRHASVGFLGGTAANRTSNAWSVQDAVDWRQKGALTGVKEQLLCRASWAFAAVAAIESAYSISTPGAGPVSASEQQVLDCRGGNSTCSGGWPGDALEYVAALLAASNGGGRVTAGSGLTPSANYEYRAKKQPQCDAKAVRDHGRVGISMWEQVDDAFQAWGVLGLLLALQRQPLLVNVHASHPSFLNYKRGVYADVECFKSAIVDHSVLLVGYVLSARQPYWIVRNSWGPAWGEDGHMRLAITGGAGICGMASTPALYAVVPGSSACGGINPCGGGKCLLKGGTGGGNECKCPPQFVSVANIDSSRSCAPVRPCTFFPSNPCQLGTCVDDAKGGYRCICSAGFHSAANMQGLPVCVQDEVSADLYKVQPGDTCYLIHTNFRLTLRELLQRNPKLKCSPFPTPGLLLNVSQDVQPGCTTLYSVNYGDTCRSIETALELRKTLLAMNPGLSCSLLVPGQQVCVNDTDGSLEEVACGSFAVVQPGDTCRDIWTKHALTPVEFYHINPGIHCSNLSPIKGQSLPGPEVCVSKAEKGDGRCRRSYSTRRGDSCQSIIYHKFKGDVEMFRALNSQFSCQTRSLYIGLRVCIPASASS